ncbi:Predicted RNA-binding protein containing a PIN domain [Aedoeadaptatus ivorii]|uniref:Predicted RNA-binding protein containing a PIN domain n=1 Tax=Aedoeadaptatus ivorii TaxID=54006 RepID=A0A3S5AKD6_9FIRM|nr:NYN domain-containing protein [Peptoniphilus ivorii]MDQ0508300.1 putative RNA-binding protein with PIN domain [Peptoniphilus ivorii]VEJ36274.1 Predicted RNA-binding protein containing a PIN domain [Peptoniphilus ivorii]
MENKRRYKRQGRYLFVDGYNIINDWEALKPLVEDRLEEARERLIEILEEFAATEHIYVILVFDAYRVKGNPGSFLQRKGMDIVFTKELETADHYIEAQIASMGRVREVVVATSDYVEQQIILARGGKRISARELEIVVSAAKNRTRQQAKHMVTRERMGGALDERNRRKLETLRRKLK